MKPIRSKRQSGAAAVELALLTLPMVIMAMGVVEFARIMYHYDIILKSTRDAVRILTAFDPNNPGDYPSALAINRVVYTDDAGTQQRLAGLTTSLVQICDRTNSTSCPGTNFSNVATGAGSGAINLVRVQVSGFQVQPMFGGGIIPAISFNSIGTTMRAVR